MAGLSNEEINQIQKSVNIVDIISEYVPLTKKGKNHFGVCPFHDDHNPSMSVSDEKGIYTCFVCHKTGNVFGFLQDYLNISFLEAVKIIADKSGIDVKTSYKVTSKYDKYYELLDLSSKFYLNNLKSKNGKNARDYLKKRKITDEIIDEFEIGLAPSGSDTLTQLLLKKGYGEELLIDSGITNEGNNLYDVMRNRITFPIHNKDGKVVAFSARIYENSNDAKYINTKETNIFKKGEILFNYHRAINEVKQKKYILLVEGYLDAIRIYTSGIKNVVATMGTALTKEHVKLLKRLNAKVIILFDNDDAGLKATISAGDMLEKEIDDIGVVRLSGKKDPDEYIIENGIEKFKDVIDNSISYFDFKINYLKQNKDLNSVDDISNYINSVIDELNKKNDPILTDLTINNLVKEYGIDKKVLENKIIKVEKIKPVKVESTPVSKLKKNERIAELLIYYMLNDTKYIRLYEHEISYIPSEKYLDIANDILAFFLKYNYINMADFITYEIESKDYETLLSIIDHNINEDIDDNEFLGIIKSLNKWVIENKIEELKKELTNTSDINKKLKINDNIAKLKKGLM